MGSLKNFFIFKMETRYMGSKFICFVSALLLLGLLHAASADTRSRTPARILAKQTGATQFEEERYETHADCNEHKHHLKKRSSDEDIDYEVYQGVVGRPGIDFPIYPRIPKTTFSCRSFGNGYFADMDTDCQVFHICEEGRKISFLCPNGTIFQQSELTCDWWFKVNCLGSPGYYAESAEILNKQRVHRVRPSVPVQGFNIVGGGLNIKPRVSSNVQRPASRQHSKSERRIDSNEEPSLESVDFDDLSGEKQLKGQKSKVLANIDNNSNDNESQITAESGSFVDGRRRNSYAYEKPHTDASERRPHGEGRNAGRNGNGGVGDGRRGGSGSGSGSGDVGKGNVNGNGERAPSQRNGYNGNGGNGGSNNGSNERARSGQRGQQRYRDDKKAQPESGESNVSNESRDTKKPALPEKSSRSVVPVDGSVRSIGGSGINAAAENDARPAPQSSTRRLEAKAQSTTPFYPSGTYSTARRPNTTRSTPYYTPTVPNVSKSKGSDGKAFYIKSISAAGPLVTTPNPSRLNTGTSSSIFVESSVAPRPTVTLPDAASSTPTTTYRPLIIGMRHNYDSASPEKHRVSVTANNHFNVELPVQKANKKDPDSGSAERASTTTAAPTTGPTYLPKHAKAPAVAAGDAAGDLLLFAPSPADDESVTRNVQEMIKTINLIKNKLDDVETVKPQAPGREGLDIPPSSGPDALVSLAKYFAGEPSGSTANSLNALGTGEKSDKSRGDITTPTSILRLPAKLPPSADSNSSAGGTTTPHVNVKADDIRASLLSEKTVSQYSNLFGLKTPKGKQGADPSEGLLSHINETGSPKEANKTAYAPFPQIGTTGATISELATKEDSRKIAQVFSNALTTYLENPQTFRAQLAAIRPTEPTVVSGKPNFVPVTATDSSLFRSGTAATYLPTRSPATADRTTTPSSIASEINQKFDYSTPLSELLSTTELFDTTTYRPRLGNSREQKHKLELSAELAPPSADSGEGDEFLQREQTQSFVKSRNDLVGKSGKPAKANSAYIAGDQSQRLGVKPTENPWNHISQADFLDPLTINDGLMKEPRTTTVSPFTYLPKETTTITPQTTTLRGNANLLSSSVQRLATTTTPTPRSTQYTRFGSAEVTTRRTQSGELDPWQDLFSTYDLPREALPSSSGLQRIANKLFGGLNETEALHLKNVMQQAEHNRQVLSLLLLLIQACDDQNGKALERSRKHLLNALIDMDGKLAPGKAAHGATTTRTPSATFGRKEATTAYPATTTNGPTWTTTTSSALLGGTSTSSSSVEETTKFEIRVEDPDEHTTTAAYATASGGGTSSDERALELLKSLYSLASKFTSRR